MLKIDGDTDTLHGHALNDKAVIAAGRASSFRVPSGLLLSFIYLFAATRLYILPSEFLSSSALGSNTEKSGNYYDYSSGGVSRTFFMMFRNDLYMFRESLSEVGSQKIQGGGESTSTGTSHTHTHELVEFLRMGAPADRGIGNPPLSRVCSAHRARQHECRKLS